MALDSKLKLLNLNDKERKKAEEKFIATLALVSEEDLNKELEFMKNHGVTINKASDIKVLAVPVEEMMKNFSILDEIHETDVYRFAPVALSYNVIDIYKRIKYCIQNSITYKSYQDGETKYEPAILKESLWRKEILNKKNNEVESMYENAQESSKDIEEKVNDNEFLDVDDDAKTTSFEAIKNDISTYDDTFQKVEDTNFDNLFDTLDINTDSLEETQKDAENYVESLNNEASVSKPELEDYKERLDNLLSFDDFSPEEYDLGNGRGL